MFNTLRKEYSIFLEDYSRILSHNIFTLLFVDKGPTGQLQYERERSKTSFFKRCYGQEVADLIGIQSTMARAAFQIIFWANTEPNISCQYYLRKEILNNNRSHWRCSIEKDALKNRKIQRKTPVLESLL